MATPLHTKPEMLLLLRESTVTVLQAVEQLPDAVFNQREEGKWSIGEVLEHLLLLEGLVKSVLMGPAQAVDGRVVNEKEELLRNTFGDMERKLSANGPIIPQPTDKDQEELQEQFIRNRQEIITFLEHADLAAACLAFQHPLFGEMTRMEWVFYVIYHANRHVRQIENLLKNNT